MYGGTVFRPMLPAPRFGVSELPLWPSPIATDGESWVKSSKADIRKSIWAVFKGGHSDRVIYHFMWHGLSPSQAAGYVEMMMGFPSAWTDLNA